MFTKVVSIFVLWAGSSLATPVPFCKQPAINWQGVDVCYECQPGYFVANAQQTLCSPCIDNACARCQNITGDNCNECKPGHIRSPNGGPCVPCGSFCTYCNEAQHVPSGQWCYQCEPGYFTDGQGECKPNGTAGSIPADCKQGVPGRCDLCDPGFYPNNNGAECKPCNDPKCANCQNNGSTCIECKPGNVRSPNGGPCVVCVKPDCKYCDQNQWCYECNAPKTPDGQGGCQ